MGRYASDRPRYDELRRGRRTLGLLAPLVQLGFLGLGLGIFLDQSRSLLSDAQFTWGERQVMGIVASLALGGCGFAGWIVGRLIKVAAEIVDVLADGAGICLANQRADRTTSDPDPGPCRQGARSERAAARSNVFTGATLRCADRNPNKNLAKASRSLSLPLRTVKLAAGAGRSLRWSSWQ